MTRKAAVIFLIAAFMNFMIGCTNTEVYTVNRSDFGPTDDKVVSLTMLDGRVIQFDDPGGVFHAKYQGRENIIVGNSDQSFAWAPIDSVLEVQLKRTEVNVGGTIALVGVLVLVVVAIVAIGDKDSPPPRRSSGTQSCPFVYSYDGDQYRFDAEPLGGATTEGLKRTDHSRLTHLVPDEGQYHLMIRNENQETQFIDQANLLVVDHEPGVTIVPDYAGNFYAFEKSVPPMSVTDEEGRDLRAFFSSRDDVKWQTQLPTDTSFRTQDVRHHLTLAFLKPKNGTTLPLYVNAGTAMWGSNMVREMLKMRGDRVDDWYRSVDAHGVEMDRLVWFMEREELFTLNINVREGDSWVPRGTIHGGGPMADDDRFISLDVSHMEGDTVRLMLNPPRGYWKIDCINAIENAEPVTDVTELTAAFGEDQSGKDITPFLRTADGSYYTMPEVGNFCMLRFNAPDLSAGLVRTIYLRSSGYYKLDLPKDTPEQTAFILEMGMNPGRIVRYSLEKYYEYRQQVLSALERNQ